MKDLCRALLNRICGNLQNKARNLKEAISRSTLVEVPRAVEGCWGKGVVPGATAGRGTMGGSQVSAPESRKPCGEKGQDTVNAKISWQPRRGSGTRVLGTSLGLAQAARHLVLLLVDSSYSSGVEDGE